MDLGVFRRSRVGLWAWLVLPAVLVAVMFGVTTLYLSSISRRLDRRKEFLENLPEIQRALGVTQEVLSGFDTALRAPDGADPELRALLNATAVEVGFTINSLSTEDLATGNSIDKGGVKAKVQGVANMGAIVALFNELQQPAKTFVVDSLSIGTLRIEEEPLYNVVFVLHWCDGRKG